MIRLKAIRLIKAPREICFDLSRSVDFHIETGRSVQARAEAGRVEGLSELGDFTKWTARFFGVRFAVITHVHEMRASLFWRDKMEKGLLRIFTHEYTFEDLADGTTRYIDDFVFGSRGGIAGRILDHLILKPRFDHLLQVRSDRLKQAAEE